MSNAPVYKGQGQPVLSQGSGWLGLLGGLLGHGGAPAYQGTGQPVLGTAGRSAGAAPVYRQAPSQDATTAACAEVACPAECDPFAQGPIAIIVPRKG